MPGIVKPADEQHDAMEVAGWKGNWSVRCLRAWPLLRIRYGSALGQRTTEGRFVRRGFRMSSSFGLGHVFPPGPVR
ncbi:MAG: hypothetical protein ACREFG_07090 [Chthoniobacterales bacterium]